MNSFNTEHSATATTSASTKEEAKIMADVITGWSDQHAVVETNKKPHKPNGEKKNEKKIDQYKSSRAEMRRLFADAALAKKVGAEVREEKIPHQAALIKSLTTVHHKDLLGFAQEIETMIRREDPAEDVDALAKNLNEKATEARSNIEAGKGLLRAKKAADRRGSKGPTKDD